MTRQPASSLSPVRDSPSAYLRVPSSPTPIVMFPLPPPSSHTSYPSSSFFASCSPSCMLFLLRVASVLTTSALQQVHDSPRSCSMFDPLSAYLLTHVITPSSSAPILLNLASGRNASAVHLAAASNFPHIFLHSFVPINRISPFFLCLPPFQLPPLLPALPQPFPLLRFPHLRLRPSSSSSPMSSPS